jgi:hypothetical protein
VEHRLSAQQQEADMELLISVVQQALEGLEVPVAEDSKPEDVLHSLRSHWPMEPGLIGDFRAVLAVHLHSTMQVEEEVQVEEGNLALLSAAVEAEDQDTLVI